MEDLIIKRRSIRRFQEKPVEPEKLTELFEAARYAPSWGNLQCWELIVVRAVEDKLKLASLLSPKNPATKSMETAPLVIGICGDPLKSGYYKGQQVTRYQHWFLYDLGIISQTLSLKACELGLGSVIVGSFDHTTAEEFLGVPKGYELVALIPLGYPDHDPPVPKRREQNEFVHFDRFRS
ncbi:MAG: nitroreductase [Desulfobulbaceae bacterium BRH_c16a]|nr:MAG: nitroreductase [Desulfobulbaceae bacterium BRH_c16a]